MRLPGELTAGTMSSSSSGNFLLVPIPEYPLLDCVPNKTVKIVVLGASNVGKTGTSNLRSWSKSACTLKLIKQKRNDLSWHVFGALWRLLFESWVKQSLSKICLKFWFWTTGGDIFSAGTYRSFLHTPDDKRWTPLQCALFPDALNHNAVARVRNVNQIICHVF